MRKIFCFGNEYFEGDEMAKVLSEMIKIPNFEFVISDSPNEVLNCNDEVIIMDVVKGLKDVKLIEDIDDLVLENSVTCHDLDLGFYLKLMKESGKINNVKIIGLPFGDNDYEKLIVKIKNIVKTL